MALFSSRAVAAMARPVVTNMTELPRSDEPALHDVFHQASGMIAVEGEMQIEQAAAWLRARAWTDGRLTDLAEDVVSRELTFPTSPAV